MQARVNPPLETIWVYSALNFRCNNSSKDEPLSRLSVTKELFQSISACSASCSSSKSIALMAPVIYDDPNDEDGLGSDSDDTIWPLEDLVCVWFADQIDENSEAKKGFGLFFPLLSDEIIERLSKGECEVSQLAAVVIAEAFLLRLCLDFLPGVARPELQKELRTWAVGSITGFRNFYFFETLVRMLLGPTLPVISLLNAEDETFLRKVLYDAVILVDYSFIHPERLVHLPAKDVKSLTMNRLIVTHEAIELLRKEGNQSKAISYINAFSTSHLPSQLLKWVTSEIGMGGKSSGPNGSSPKAFLKWLLNLEDQGIKLLDGGISKCHAKLVHDVSKSDYEQLAYQVGGKKSDADLGFYIDNKGEEEDGNEEEEKTNESNECCIYGCCPHNECGGKWWGKKTERREK
ncbi:hypothetical protein F0562_029913 [Nyssa sinensis]|uniref:Uncharacterized protein n=1 Tax=Nyssa sinensis TaxID=561372 RepID=A0A5J5B0S8_9ASTE|nr:hypothetical protein F0562_029913 [Nyssa sinensis]